MSTIVLRSVKGTPLTNAEVDSNFSNLNTDKIEIGGTYASGTASGVLFLNASKVLTTGSVLTFNGISLGVGSSSYGDAGTISLSVGVAGSTTGGLQLWGTTTTEHFIQWGDGTSGSDTYRGAISYGHASDFMRFWTSSTEQMRLTSTGLELKGKLAAGYTDFSGIPTNGAAFAGSVGIGTSSPAYKLTVAGFSDAANNVLTGSQIVVGTTFGIRERGNTNGISGTVYPTQIYQGNSGGGHLEIYNVSSAYGIVFGTQTTERARIDSSGNLGLGVTSPSQKLELAGVLRVKNGNADTNGLNLSSDVNGIGYINAGYASAGQIVFQTEGTERMRLTSTGLQVTGTVSVGTSSTPTKLNVYVPNSTGPVLTLGGADGIGNVTGVRIGYGEGGSYCKSAILFENTDPAYATGSLHLCVDSVQDSGNAVLADSKLTINSSGYVGIGTTTPQLPLEVQSLVSFNNDAGRNVLIISKDSASINTGGGIAFGGYYSGTSSLINDFAGIQGFKENATAGDYAGALRITTRTNGGSPTERVRITSAGRVGIGTNNPTNMLDVRGTNPIIRVEPNVSTDAASFQAINDGKISYFGRENSVGDYFFSTSVTPYSTVLNAYGSTAPIIFGHNGPEVYIVNGGNVGIGSSAPDCKLQVEAADGAVGGAIRYTATSVASVYMSADPNGLCLATDTAGITFRTGVTGNDPTDTGSERMRIDSAGNVGINTNSPSAFGKVAIQVTGTTSPTTAANVGPASINLYNGGDGGSTDSTMGVFGWHAGDPGIGSGIGFTRENDGNWGSQLRFYTHPTATSNIGNITERARFDAEGSYYVGTTSATGLATGSAVNQGFIVGLGTLQTQANANANMYWAKAAGFTSGDFTAHFANNVYVGGISTNGSTTNYATSSDYRLKENVQPMTGALVKVAQLKPVTYTWKSSGQSTQGFIAHELQSIVPDCVVGEKDALNEDGSIKPQGVDTSFLVATLTAAIQEQQAIIESLMARLDAANL